MSLLGVYHSSTDCNIMYVIIVSGEGGVILVAVVVIIVSGEGGVILVVVVLTGHSTGMGITWI